MNHHPLLQTQLLEAILNSIDEAIHVVNQEGITIFYNHNASENDGMNQEEVIGKHLFETFPSLSEESSTLFTVLRTGKPITHRPQRFQNRKGKVIETVNTTLPIYLEGKLAGAVEISKNYSRIQSLTEEIRKLQMKIATPKGKKETLGYYHFSDYLTRNAFMLQRLKDVEKVAQKDVNVLIYGETGSGKEVIVQGIHQASPRRAKPFVVQNCAAIPEALLESILFGTTKGSYTGAMERPGLFELAHEGTLFLDELNSMPIQLQAKLLRVLEDGHVRRIGSSTVQKVNVRVVSAMNEEPKSCIEKGKLRGDLYYRIGLFSFELMPLREKKEDIPLLMSYFSNMYGEGRDVSFSREVESALNMYHWPGNVRELKSTIQYALTMWDGERVTLADLPMQFHDRSEEIVPIRSLKTLLEETERQAIEQALQQTKGNVFHAAKLLGVPRQTLQYKIGKLLPKIQQ